MATLSVMTLGPSPQKMTIPTTCVLLTTQSSASTQISQNSPTPPKSIVIHNNNNNNINKRVIDGATASSPNNTSDMLRCKRRISFSHLNYGLPHAQPAAVARRNARERNRVKQVNNGFTTLRQHIPYSTRNKKMSKVETLRCAVEYIKNLQQILDENEGAVLHLPTSTSTGVTTTTTTTVTGGAGSDQGYYSSPETIASLAEQCFRTQPVPSSLSPPCSEASSPTPSYASEGSSSYAATSVYENYENYEPMSPEDEELLDVISWWQSQ